MPEPTRFDVASALQEFRFHLRELRADFKGLSADVRALLTEPSPAADRVRYQLNFIFAGLQHCAEHHAPRALALADMLAGAPSADGGRLDWATESAGLDQQRSPGAPLDDPALAAARDQIAVALQRLDAEVAQLAADARLASSLSDRQPPELQQIQETLGQMLHALLRRALPDVLVAHGHAVAVHRTVDPAAAAEEDALALAATALHELPHRDARGLNSCPSCGAALTSEDRTFTGSYCEHCRTRWYEPST